MKRIAFTLFVSYEIFVAISAAQQSTQTPNTVSTAAPSIYTGAQSVTGGEGKPNAIDHVLEDGTPVRLRLINQISSTNAKSGQPVEFEVADDLALDSIVILHRGTQIIGVVVEAKKKGKLGRPGILNLTIASLKLTDGENVPLRSFDNTSGDSHAVGVAALALNMPLALAPFFLLMRGENSTFPKGTELTVFTSGNRHLDLTKFSTMIPKSAAR